METLAGRAVHIPRSVFARDIARGSSEEPPNGKYWQGTVTEWLDEGSMPFTLTLEVLDEDGELGTEE